MARYPADREGRLLLAQLYADNQREDLAKELLKKGLEYHPTDPEYARVLFAYLLSVQADEEVIRLGEAIQRSPAGGSTPLGGVARFGVATACYHRGYFDRAEGYLAAPDLRATQKGRLLEAKIQWERGYPELALHQLRTLAEDFPGDDEIYIQLSAYLRQNRHFDEAHQLTLVFQMARPDSAQPRIDLLHDYARAVNTAALRQTAAEILRLFSRDERNLLALGDFAATTGQPALARQVRARLTAGSRSGESAALLTMEALIVAKEYPAALALAEELAGQTPPLSPRLQNLSQGLGAIAHYGNNDPEAGRLALSRFVAGANLRAGNLLAIANRLREVGARPQARDLLARAAVTDPGNQPVLSRLIELEIVQGDFEALPAHLLHLLAMRKPSRNLLARAGGLLGSDRFIFSRERFAALDAIKAHLALPVKPTRRGCISPASADRHQ
jgi:hypothetical protein